MANFTETTRAGEFILSDAPGRQSYDSGVLLSGAGALIAGAVLGKITTAAVNGTVVQAGTGDGALTMDATTPVLAGAKVGSYVVKCITAAAHGGTFRVEDPDGFVLGDVLVGATFADDIKFAIADGAEDFIVGDSFTIPIAAGSLKFVAHDAALTNGAQHAVAILHQNADATDADAPITVVARAAEVKGALLTWKSGISAPNKAAGIASLAANHILVR